VEIDHLAEVPIITRFQLSDTETIFLPHIGTKIVLAQPKVHCAKQGWLPGQLMSESTLHSWDPLHETQWNALLRATSNIKINGYSVLTISVTVDVNYYRARYTHEMIFNNGESAVNVGYMYSASVGAIVFEIGEI
jgi:hypothetical protein